MPPDSLISNVYLKYLPNSVLPQNGIDSIKVRFNKIENTNLSRESQIALLKEQKHFKDRGRISRLRKEEHILSSALNLTKKDFLTAIILVLIALAYVVRPIVWSIVWAIKTATDNNP